MNDILLECSIKLKWQIVHLLPEFLILKCNRQFDVYEEQTCIGHMVNITSSNVNIIASNVSQK